MEQVSFARLCFGADRLAGHLLLSAGDGGAMEKKHHAS